MAHKSEIGWKRSLEDGSRREHFARKVGGEYQFFKRARRFDQWERVEHPPLEDWLELLDAIERRVVRRLLQPDDLEHIKQRVKESFPEWEMPS